MMQSLLDDDAGCQLPVADAQLRWWSEVDFGRNKEQILHELIDECSWRQEEIRVYGKAHLQPRLSAWYGDFGYSYSGIRLQPMPWTPLLRALKAGVERLCGHEFNSVLLNYYRDGNDKMGMHSDDERELGAQPVIASLSFGETRNLLFRHRHRKDLETIKLPLGSGSLLLMSGDTQRNWRHGINAERRCRGARVNLTFRNIITTDPDRQSDGTVVPGDNT